MKQCVDCSVDNLPDSSRFCPECGNPVTVASSPSSRASVVSAASKTNAARLAIENAKRRQHEMIAKRSAVSSPPSTLPRNMKLSSGSSSTSSTADRAEDDSAPAAGGFTMAFDNVLAAIDTLAADAADAFPDVPVAAPLPPRSFSPPAARPAPLVSASSGPVKSATQYGQISQIMRPGAGGGAGAPPPPAAAVSPRDGPPLRAPSVPQLAVGTKASRAAGLDVGSANNSGGAFPDEIVASAMPRRIGSDKRVNRDRADRVTPQPTIGPPSAQVDALVSPRFSPPPAQATNVLQTQSLGSPRRENGLGGASSPPTSARSDSRRAESPFDAEYANGAASESSENPEELSRVAVLAFGRDMQHTDSLTAHDLRGFAWYHGALSADDAFAMLRKLDKGTFLVRQSSRPQCFTISWVRLAKTIVHTLVTPHKEGWVMDGEVGKVYKSVWDCVLLHPKSFQAPLRGPFCATVEKFGKQ
jgi:hypothetical protein